MTTATISPAPRQASRRSSLRWLIADVAVLARRVLARIAREPETLMDVTIQPVLFVLLFGYAFTWVGASLGMVLRSPEAAQQMGFVLFLPLTFVSNAFVPTQGMPGWLQPIAEWNPMSALAAASRSLFGNPNPAASVQAWPMQHPELAVIGWSTVLLAVFAPLAVHLYRRKAAG